MISFVVPAHNEAALIARTLDAIAGAAAAAGEPHEVIVVDDGSSDGTASIAAGRGARVVRIERRQIAAARNAGAREARGETLVFVDADTVISAELLAASLAALRRGAAGGGATLRFDGRIPRHGRILAWAVLGVMRLARWAAGCYIFCRRDAFAAVGGFDERLFAAEEVALSRALKRHGAFVILRETVLSSGRKLRTYSRAEIARLIGFLLRTGPRGLRDRQALDLWYGGRRADPGEE